MAKAMLRESADCNASNHAGNTPLHFATAYGYEALAKYLLTHGADDTIMNISGKTCYDGI
jgi:ankyrin repeat protein